MAKKILPIQDLSKDAKAVFDSVNREKSDLACALILTAYLEQCIGSLIAKRFIESSLAERILDPKGGLLGSFKSRVDLAYALGLITKGMYSNLSKVAEIRNTFAHSHIDVKFEDSRIHPLCEKLDLPAFVIHPIMNKSVEQVESDIHQFISTPRMRFTLITVMLANRLMLTGLATEHLPRKRKGWEDKEPAA